MKQFVNFRLDSKSLSTLILLEKELHTSKTDIIKQALLYFAKKKLPERRSLLSFAGVLNEKDADDILDTNNSNNSNKRNKAIIADL